MPDQFVNQMLKKNEMRFFDEEAFDKEHGEKYDNIAIGLKKSVEMILKQKNDPSIEIMNQKINIPNDAVIKHHIKALKRRDNIESAPNEKLMS